MSSGAATEQALPRLELWLAFWHFRYRQWGGFMELVSLYLPNLSCIVHSLWFNYIDSAIILIRTVWALQDLSEAELAEMPSCNLAESIHNKWKQQSGDRGIDLYVATVDDCVRAFMQCSAYSQFLKGENPGTGPSKEELKLRRAQRSAAKTGNSKLLHEAILKMPGNEEWCTRTPHLKGEEVFVSL